jgi:hypothetical protein
MDHKNLISVLEICRHHNIDCSFMDVLRELGLIEMIFIEKVSFIEETQLPQLEKYITFHYLLDINLEGIEAISHLLRHITALQEEAVVLKNHLQFYQTNK